MKITFRTNDMVGAFALFVFAAELVFPWLSTVLPYTYVCLACFLIWIFVSYLTSSNRILTNSNVVLFLIYTFLIVYGFITGYSMIAHRYTSYILVICGSIVYDFYYTTRKTVILKRLVIFTTLLASVTLVRTFSALLLNPYISRSIKSKGEYSESLAKMGIGGYSFVYFIVPVGVLFLYIFFRIEEKKWRVLSLAGFIICAMFVIKSNYVTALFVLMLSSSILILFAISSDRRFGILYGIIASVLFLVISMNLSSLVFLFADFLPNRIRNVFVNQGNYSIIYSLSNEFIKDRWPVMQNSIQAFLKHPLWGIMGSGDLIYSGGSLYGFGQHSYILDSYALFGIIGGTLAVIAAISPFRKPYRHTKDTAIDIAMAVCLILLFTFNNATDSMALVFSIFYPFTKDLIIHETKNIE